MRLHALRYQHHLRQSIKAALVACAAALIGYGAYQLACEYMAGEQRVKHAELVASRAEADRKEVLNILAGDLVMIEPIGSMAKVATVKWELVEVTK